MDLIAAVLILYTIVAVVIGIVAGINLSFAAANYANAKAILIGLFWPLVVVATGFMLVWDWITKK